VATGNRHFVVVQNMLEPDALQQLESARRIVAFLHEQGVAAFVCRSSSGGYRVVSDRPFASSADPEIHAHVKQIEALGRQYSRVGGRYNFNHGEHIHAVQLPWPVPGDMKVQ
jgi:hypothetical protein